jgi:hypothetical protein
MKVVKFFLGSLAVAAVMSSCTVIVPVAVSNAEVGTKVCKSTTGVLFGSIELNGSYGVADAVKQAKYTGPVACVDEKYNRHPLWILFYTKEMIVTGK